MLQAQVLDS